MKEGLLETLVNLSTAALRGLLPESMGTLLLAARLLPFRKADGAGVRPIAVGEVLRRLLAKALLNRLTPRTQEVLPPLQCGVGIRDSDTSPTHCGNASTCAIQLKI